MEELNKCKRRRTAVVKLSEKKLKFFRPGRGKGCSVIAITKLHGGKIATIGNLGYLIFIDKSKTS